MSLDLSKPQDSNSFLRELYKKFFGISENPIVVEALKPSLVDTTSATLMYEGYKDGSNYRICKIDLSTAIITRTWATGSWANRASLTYA
jgi:hypothetical protein